MAKNLFSVPIFLICFREVLEAAIILSVLLALVEQIVARTQPSTISTSNPLPQAQSSTIIPDEPHTNLNDSVQDKLEPLHTSSEEIEDQYDRKLLKRMRLQVSPYTHLDLYLSFSNWWYPSLIHQIFSGTFSGLFISVCIGATFLAIYYTQLNDLYGHSEELWGKSLLALYQIIHIIPMTLYQSFDLLRGYLFRHCLWYDLRHGHHHDAHGSS